MNECVYLMGADCVYIARESASAVDWILGEDPTSKFEKSYPMEMLITNVDQWNAGADLFSKFGMKINKGTNVVVTRRTFNKYVPETLAKRPREGDLVYIPPLQKLFEIKFVNHEDNFYTHGKVLPYYYELQLEMFKYSHEPIDTGIDEIDQIENDNTYIIDFYMVSGSGDYQKNEMISSGTVLAKVKEWNPETRVLSVYSISGSFEDGAVIEGVTSGASWTIGDFDELEDSEENRLYTNIEIESEANTFISTTETNPFGAP